MEIEGSPFAVGPIQIILGGDSSAGVTSIQAHDPGFDTTNFLAWVQQVHFALVSAFDGGEPESLRRYVGASLYPRLAAQVAAATQQGHPAAHHAVDDDHPVIHGAHTDASLDTVVVRLKSAVGSPATSSGLVDWTFQRSSQATTPPGGLSAAATATCAGCGAPLKLDAAGDCIYCKAPAAAGKADWVLVAIETATPDVRSAGFPMPMQVSTQAATGCLSRVWIIGLVLGVLGIAAAIIVPLMAATGSVKKAFSARPVITVPSPISSAKTLTTRLTLSGAINLPPSDLSSQEFIVNGAANGACPAANQPLRTVVLNVTFDSGAKLQGAFVLPPNAAPNTSVDLASGGTAAIHFVGPTQAVNDEQSWTMPPGQAGAVTVSTNPAGGGTLKWQNLPAAQATHNFDAPSSGLATWTCA